MHAAAAAVGAGFAFHPAAGHDRYYLGDVAYVRDQRAVFEAAISPGPQ